MYVDVILPLALEGVLTYRVPDELVSQVAVGQRILVPIGQKKIITGIICSLTPATPLSNDIVYKDILCYLDEQPIVTDLQLQLWKWVAQYYLCTLGEVMRAALPVAFRLESETKVQLNPDYEISNTLSLTQRKVVEMLQDAKLHEVAEISKKTAIKSILPALNQLFEMGAVSFSETVAERYKPKTQSYVFLAPAYQNEAALQTFFQTEQKSPKQTALLQAFLQRLADENGEFNAYQGAVEKSQLLQKAGASDAVLKGLMTKGVLEAKAVRTDRIGAFSKALHGLPTLNPFQQTALQEIHQQWEQKEVTLLHGVTSSGKTEIYIHLIEETLQRGQQVLYLVPEIALTTQLTERLQAVFGDRLGIYHSQFSDMERVETYQKLLKGDYSILLGVRSSLFLPYQKLGLIIVDEEHESSYKQDKSPCYHARNTAIILAHMAHAKVLLGSATPAIETYFNALNGKYGLVRLTHRYQNLQLPALTLIDLKEQYHRKEMQGHFADPLVAKMTEELDRHKQVILFQNRRGYAPYLLCQQCGYVPKCVNCNVNLTVHKHQHTLVCHYCGYTIPLPERCPACGKATLSEHGFGTEKIEDEVQALFPKAKISRMDLDTTRRKNAYQHIISEFADHQTDILIGTQMVSKGLHFNDVSLVAVLNADNLMSMPSFRADEQTFQLLEQVSGRAGRNGSQGEVYIQTFTPDHTIFQHIQAHDYETFYRQQIKEREMFKYPPFYRLLEITIRHRDERAVQEVATQLQQVLKGIFTRRCSPVIVPIISKVQNLYLRTILIKIETTAPYDKGKTLLCEAIQSLRTTPQGRTASFIIDVDPL